MTTTQGYLPSNNRADDNSESFVRYLNNVAPGLVYEASDISYISRTTTMPHNAADKSARRDYLHGNIADELNNYDDAVQQRRVKEKPAPKSS